MNKRSSFWFAVVAATSAVVLALELAVCEQRSSDIELQRFGNIGTSVAAVAGFVGLLVLIVYTRETFLLRKTAEDQNETNIKPVVTLDVSTIEVGLGQPLSFAPLRLKNIGTGPAFNVKAKPIVGNGVEMRIRDVPLLGANESCVIAFTILQAGQPCANSLEEPLLREHLERGNFPQQMTVELKCDGLSGRRYRTLHEITYAPHARAVRTSFQRIEAP